MELNVWLPLHESDQVVQVPEKRMVLFKNEGCPNSFHLGMIFDGIFHESDSYLNGLFTRRDLFSFRNNWGKSFTNPHYKPTHFMLLE